MINYATEVENDALGKASDMDDVYNKEKKIKWYDRVLLNRPSKIIITGLLVSILVPLLLYNYLLSSTLDLPPPDGYSFGSCLLPRETRIPCGHGNITESQCHPQCCYDLNNFLCFHRLPSRFSYLMDREWSENLNMYPRIATEPFQFQQSFTSIRLSVDEVTKSHLTLTLYNSNLIEGLNGSRLNEVDYSYRVSSPEFNIEVSAEQGTIFSTNRGPLIASTNIFEITFKLTNETMYGLGEIPLTSNTIKVLYNHRGGLSSIPMIFAKSNGSYHGMLIDIETPTELTILEDNQIVIRSITDTQLKLHLFVGPEPRDIMRDVMDFMGTDNSLQYWMLGAHVCNSNYEESSEEAYESFTKFLQDSASANIPYESHCGVSPVLISDVKDELVDLGASAVKQRNKRFIPHISPYVKYIHNEIQEEENSTSTEQYASKYANESSNIPSLIDINTTYVGEANGFNVTYPDYTDDITKEVLLSTLNSTNDFDGIILENNWPLDESFTWVNVTRNYLPYFTYSLQSAFNETPKWNLTYANGDLYMYRHNKYGDNFYAAVKEATPNLPLWSSSQWKNGRAMINRQHIDASWANLRKELVEAALGGISGHWLWSSPICGDTINYNNETQVALCVSWYMTSTYMPLIKIHSNKVPRHPLAFNGNHRNYVIDALNKRLCLLPYFFTVLQEGPLLRPMFYQFPNSKIENVVTQFSVGDDLLIVPNLLPSQSHVNVWMPPGKWYELWSGLKLDAEEGEPVTMSTTEADFLSLVRGGSILFMQKNVQATAEETRLRSNYSLTVAINCERNWLQNTERCEARGRLYLTTGMSLNASVTSNNLMITAQGEDFSSICANDAISASFVEEINIYGLNETNNYDHFKRLETEINLCNIRFQPVVLDLSG